MDREKYNGSLFTSSPLVVFMSMRPMTINDTCYFRKKRLSPQNTEDGTRYFDTDRFNNELSSHFRVYGVSRTTVNDFNFHPITLVYYLFTYGKGRWYVYLYKFIRVKNFQ